MTDADYEAALYGTAGSTARASHTCTKPTRDCLIVPRALQSFSSAALACRSNTRDCSLISHDLFSPNVLSIADVLNNLISVFIRGGKSSPLPPRPSPGFTQEVRGFFTVVS